MIEHYGGSVCDDEGLINYEKKNDGNVTTSKNYAAVVRAKVLDCAVIKRANSERYSDLLKDLRKQHSYGQDLYPNIVEIAHNMLNKHELLNEQRKKTHPKKDSDGKDKSDNEPRGKYQGQQYAQQGTQKSVKGIDGRTIAHITCFKCNRSGHYSDN